MGAEELNQRFFTRDRVRNRMLKKAAELWGFSESEIEDFDPLVTLLIESCSVEFEKISQEIGTSQNRMLERIAQLLYPGTITVHPAFAILQARSLEPQSILRTDAQFVCRVSGNDRKTENSNIELFFSPSHNTRIVDGAIKIIASAREIFSLEEGNLKYPVANTLRKHSLYQHSVFLGIDLHEEIISLEGLSVFFNWIGQAESKTWVQYLPYTEWFIENNPLSFKVGFDSLGDKTDTLSDLEREFDMMLKIEQETDSLYEPHFLTVSSKESFDKLKVKRKPYPSEFEQLFDKKDLQNLKESLIWIEIRFPTKIPFEALDSLWCSINSFPVLNRKINKFSYKLLQSLNIVPLDTDGVFLSVREITNSLGNPSKLIPFANSASLQPETYTLRYGVNRFDERNSYDTLVNLAELIKEESSYFSSIGEDFLRQNIKELNQILARLQEKVKNQNKHQSPYPYLIIKPSRDGANITIEFWSCNGDIANKISAGSRLQSYRNNYVKDNFTFLMTSTSGGRDKFDDAEKIDQYKKSLLSHNRIVTMEDLKIATNAELGRDVKSIEFEKIFIHGVKSGEGLIRCIEIKITPDRNAGREDDWDLRLKRLQLNLERNSANNIPYRLTLVN